MTVRRILAFSALAAFVLMWSAAIVDFGSLPARFPAHFDGAGVPDAYAVKSASAWFALPIIFTVMSAFFALLAVYVPRLSAKHATYVNLPDKEAFLALPEEKRLRALEPIRDMMIAMIVPLGLMAAYIVHGSWLVAVGATRTLSAWPALATVVFAISALAVAVVRTKRAIAAERA